MVPAAAKFVKLNADDVIVIWLYVAVPATVELFGLPSLAVTVTVRSSSILGLGLGDSYYY